MKYLFFLIALSFSLASFGQSQNDDWILGVGVNAVNNLGTRSPIEKSDEWAFNKPISISAEKQWFKSLSIEVLLGLNEFSQKEEIDGETLGKDYTYFSVDTNLKYYFGKHLFNTSQFDLFVTGGPGLFIIDEANTSLNVGGGALVWFNNKQSFGLKLQTVSKFALNAKAYDMDNNHFQYHAQLVFRL